MKLRVAVNGFSRNWRNIVTAIHEWGFASRMADTAVAMGKVSA